MMRQQKYKTWKKHEENMVHLENSHLESRDGGLFLPIALFQFSASLSQCGVTVHLKACTAPPLDGEDYTSNVSGVKPVSGKLVKRLRSLTSDVVTLMSRASSLACWASFASLTCFRVREITLGQWVVLGIYDRNLNWNLVNVATKTVDKVSGENSYCSCLVLRIC